MVFQFGDFFNSSSTNPYLIELIRATYTILIFFVGIWYSRYRDEEKSTKDRAELRNYIFTIVGFLDKPFDTQVNSINKLVESMRVDDQEAFALERVPEFNVDNIKRQPDNDLYKAFVTKLVDDKDKINSFVNFRAAIDYFDRIVNESIMGNLNDFYAKNQEFTAKVKASGDAAFDLARSIVSKEMDDVAKEIWQVSIEFVRKSKEREGELNNSFFTYENAILPLLDVCNKNYEDKRCLEMDETLDCL